MVYGKFGIAVGIKGKRGFPTTKRTPVAEKKAMKRVENDKKRKEPKRREFAKGLIYEVTGFAPYEHRVLDLVELSEKKALKFAKKRVRYFFIDYIFFFIF